MILLGVVRAAETLKSRYCPASGQHAAIGGGEPVSIGGSNKLLHGLAVRSQARRKDPPIPRAHRDAPAIAGELVGEILGIVTQRIGTEGSCPRHHAGNAIEAIKDLRWRGGRLMISRRILPWRAAVSLAAMTSMQAVRERRDAGRVPEFPECAR